MRLCSTFVALVLILSCAVAAAEPAADGGANAVLHPFKFVGNGSDGIVKLQFDKTSFEEIRGSEAAILIEIPLGDDRSLKLRLAPFVVMAPDAQFICADQGNTSFMSAKPQVVTLRGAVEGKPGSTAYLAFSASGATLGVIKQPGEPDRWLHATRAMDGSRSVWLGGSGVGTIEQLPFCETPEATPQLPLSTDTMIDLAKGPRLLRIAIDGDQSFVQLFDTEDEAHEYVVMLIGAISDIFLRDLNFRMQVGFSRMWPNGGTPFTPGSLSSFRNHWLANENMTNLNLFHLLRGAGGGGAAFDLANGCSDEAFARSGGMQGWFPSPVGDPHIGNWDLMVVAHEIGHNLGAPHTFEMDPPIDNCFDGSSNQRGTIMSYCASGPGGLLNVDMRFHARSAEFIAASNSLPNGACLYHDCNGNGIDDADDVATAASIDFNGNGIPDECEDCNGNDVLDPEEIAQGAPDVDGNGLLDACEADCNSNTLPDKWETSTKLATDENGNWIPDECDPDCDGNGVADFKDIEDDTHTDIDRNSVPDVCQDCNANGLADWDDMDRQFFPWVSRNSGVAECHHASFIPTQIVNDLSMFTVANLEFGPDGSLYVAAFNSNRVVRVNPTDGTFADFVPSGPTGVFQPNGLTFGPDGHLYVSSYGTSSIWRYDGKTGKLVGAFVPSGSGGLLQPYDLLFHPNGNLLVVSSNNHAVFQFDGKTGAPLGAFGDANHRTLNAPRSLALLPNGNLVVTNINGPTVLFDSVGEYLGPLGTSAQTWGMTVGPNGNVFTVGGMIREFDGQTGTLISSSPVQGMSGGGIAFRPASPADRNGNNVLDVCETPCIADISDPQNGVVDVDDLLEVINNWGDCSSPPALCIADISKDGTVDVDDLLIVINRWGACN
jgi:WD40 repeat protein